MSFKCDWKEKNECRKKPYAEIFYEDEHNEHHWCYLCFWHFLYARFRGDEFGYCKVNTDREMLENILEEIWDIEGDLIEIKEKLGLRTEYPDCMKKIWNNKEDKDYDKTD